MFIKTWKDLVIGALAYTDEEEAEQEARNSFDDVTTFKGIVPAVPRDLLTDYLSESSSTV